MKRLALFAAATCIVLTFAVTAWAGEKGFVPLFNGEDLVGWTTEPDSGWTIEHGILMLRDNKDGPKRKHAYLWTEKTYGDFILELEFKVPEQANSGIFVRTGSPMDPVQTGIEIQVCNSYGKETWTKGSCVGAIYDCVAPSENRSNPPGEWNHYQITCKGSEVSVAVNGKTVAEMDMNNWTEPRKNPDGTKNKFRKAVKDFPRSGHIGLQDHGTAVSFRNIMIKELKD